MHLLYEETIKYSNSMDLNTDFIFIESRLLDVSLFYLPCECPFGFLLFNSQSVHPHPVITMVSAIISRPTTIPRAVLVASQLFILVSPIQESSCCVVGGHGLVVSNVVVVDGGVSFAMVSGGV
jgi:hypothetical protein